MRATFTISILAWDKALPLARPVREQVFVAEQKVPLELEWDEWDERSDHAVARDSKGQAIGTARLLPDGRIGRWRYSANAQARDRHRAPGGPARAGPQALNASHYAARANPCGGVLSRFGFNERGEEFLEAEIPHVEMTLELFPARE